ncbi:MAG: Gfo/Idh/MocA family protein [bacterium]
MFLTWYRPDSYYRESDWKGTWDKEGGGVLIDQAIHTIDLMQWLIGKEIDYINARYDTWAHDFIKVDDVAEAYIKFKPDIVGCVYANCFYPYDAPVFLEIYGSKGVAHIIGDKGIIQLGNRTIQVEQSSNPGSGLRYWGSSHERQIKDFYKDLLLENKPFIDGEAGRVALSMVLAMYQSSRLGKPIKFPI